MLRLATTRSVRDDVKEVLDYLQDAELAIFTNEVSFDNSRVSWHTHDPGASFIVNRDHATLDQFCAWVNSAALSAILFDGSLLQITYDVANGEVVRHRLAYVPCPFIIDTELLHEGEALADIIEVYSDNHPEQMALRSPVRFDYDPSAAAPGHPPAHMTINGADCRIACVSPMHVLRFVDFVFRNFYKALHAAHRDFFSQASTRHVGERVLPEDEAGNPHIMWAIHTPVV
jgi:hypothetical protein